MGVESNFKSIDVECECHIQLFDILCRSRTV